jgi:hypothetical protein
MWIDNHRPISGLPLLAVELEPFFSTDLPFDLGRILLMSLE